MIRQSDTHDDEAGNEQSADTQAPWAYLTSEERARHADRLAALLDDVCGSGAALPIQADNRFDALEALAADDLVTFAYLHYYEWQVGAVGLQRRAGTVWFSAAAEAEASAAASAGQFRRELARRFRQDVRVLFQKDVPRTRRELVCATVRWWFAVRTTGKGVGQPALVVRCADQLSLMLVFTNLSCPFSVRRDGRITQDRVGAEWWSQLAYRAARKVLKPYVRGPFHEAYGSPARNRKRESAAGTSSGGLDDTAEARSRAVLSDPEAVVYGNRVEDCLAVLWSVAVETVQGKRRYVYEGNGRAVRYFAEAYRQWRAPSESVRTISSDEILEESRLEATDNEELLGAVTWSPEEQLLRDAESPNRREALWQRLWWALGRSAAIRMWVLLQLRETYKREWTEILRLVQEPRCGGVLDEDDLPRTEAITWQNIEDEFRAMARKSRKTPGVLTREALGMFFGRSETQLKQYAGRSPEPGRGAHPAE